MGEEPHIRNILEYVRDGRRWKNRNENEKIAQKAKDFVWKNGRLYKVTMYDGFEYDRVVLPKSMKDEALKRVHDSLDGGHFGRKRT